MPPAVPSAEPRPAPPPIAVAAVEPFGRGELLERLRATRLRGFGGPALYADAEIAVVDGADADAFTPAQRYVLRPQVATALALRAALLAHGVDPFALDGGAWVRLAGAPDEPIPVIPPIVEESHEPDGRTVLIVNDGLHRLYAARSVGLPITTVVVRGVPREYPYYAYALADGWAGVAELDALAPGFQKKAYRLPGGYKALFRDFNAVFPGVQAQRAQTNPAHLRP